MTDITRHEYQGYSIAQQLSDGGYVSLTDMAKINGRLVGDYLRLKSTKAYCEALSPVLGIPITGLIVVRQGGDDKENQGTWAHPELALDFAQWVSPQFRVWANRTLLQQVVEQSVEREPDEYEQLFTKEPKPARALPTYTAAEYVQCAKDIDAMEDSILTRLLRDRLADELSLNQVALPGTREEYTILKVRATELGYTVKEIGTGTALGKYVRARVEPEFQERINKYPVWHYKVTPTLDATIREFFNRKTR